MASIVYLATNRVNGKRYVGVTGKRLRWRRAGHEYEALKGNAGCRKFHAAIRKYGPAAFEWTELERFESYEDALAGEVRLIADLKPEYNILIGGQSGRGFKHTAEWKAAKSASMTGRKHSPEVCAAIAEAGRGRKHSEESKRRMSAVQKGKIISDKQRAQMSAARLGKKLSPEHRKKVVERLKAWIRPADFGQRISAGKKGKPLTAAHRAALSAAHKGRPMSDAARAAFNSSWVKGMKMPPEIIARRLATWKRNREAAHVSVSN